MKKKVIIGFLALLLIFSGIVGFLYYQISKEVNVNTIYSGVRVGEVDLGGMTKEEAISKISTDVYPVLAEKNLTLTYLDKVYTVAYKDLGLSIKESELTEKAYAVGRTGSVMDRYKVIRQLKKEPMNISLSGNFDEGSIDAKLSEIATEINVPPAEASINYEGGQIVVTPGQPGRKVDLVATKKSMTEALNSLDSSTIEISVSEEKPAEGLALDRINGVIGEFTTSFSGSTQNRKDNIALATSKFHGKIIAPGEIISFNETTGPRSSEAGYKSAGVIIGNKLESGLGGGVCQASTTLYNAVLRADLTVLERRAHTLPVGYVAKGCDGAVSYGSLDMKFINDFEFPLFLAAYTSGDQVTYKIYGDTTVKNYEVQISSEQVGTVASQVIEKVNPNAEPGSRVVEEQGRTGLKYVTYKTKIRNGEVISSERITSDYYPAVNTVVILGPPVPEPEAQAPADPNANGSPAPDTNNTNNGKVSPAPTEPAEPVQPQEETVNLLP
ncbi:MAG: hypothetical protein GXZ11_03495 [Tissierellia bacterium]|nr:hypothetical protein [Tissierellia bacterium]